MEMPGGWTMSMMWMRMRGQTWFASAISFLLMWLAMMMPSALPMYLKTRRQWSSLCYMASGYFASCLAAGVGIYALGVAFAMRSELFSRAVPLLAGASLITAGAIQFTRWKITPVALPLTTWMCQVVPPQHETNLRLGCKQGAACCVCCAAPMIIQLALGIMNPLVMIVVAIVIVAKKLLRRPEITARLVGVADILPRVTTTIYKLNQ